MATEETNIEFEVEVKSEELELEVEMKTKSLEEGAKKVTTILDSLKKDTDKAMTSVAQTFDSGWEDVKNALSGVGEMIAEAFTVDSPEALTAATERFGADFANSLYDLQTNMDGMQTAIVDAVAPIAEVFVPIINEAVEAVTGLVNSVGQVTGAIFGTVAGTDALAESASAVGSTAEAVAVLPGTVNDTLSPQLQSIVDKVLGLVEPLKAIDISPVVTAFGGLQTVFASLSQEVFAGLEWAYLNLFVPLAAWTTEGLLPGFLDLLSGAMGVLNEVVATLQPLVTWLWDSFLDPIAQWTGGTIAEILQLLADKLGAISTWISENQILVETLGIVIGSFAAALGLVNGAIGIWNVLSAVGASVTGAFAGAISFLTSPIGIVVAAIAAVIAIVVLLVKNFDAAKAIVASVWETIKEVFGNAWNWFKDTLLDPLVNGFKGMVNGIIGFINGMIQGAVDGINSIIGLLNKLQFDIPDWVPGLGGETFGFNIGLLNAPQIPYLAKGAVLPANKPFLAMVGDQRHGTNVEAPLATIQEAVALVMNDQVAAMMAGFEATVEEVRLLRQLVSGIEIGDKTIGQAARRYERKMAVVTGGRY